MLGEADAYSGVGTKVKGLGDAAGMIGEGFLEVRIRDRTLSVLVTSDTIDEKEAALAIARLALPRVP